MAAKGSSKPSLDTIGDEVIRAFETDEVMEKLRKLECALNSLPASSVECKRFFSTIGQFHSKIRNRLDDSCFLNTKMFIESDFRLHVIYLLYVKLH